MTDIRRSAVSDQDNNKIVKYQVEEKKDDKLRRHAVIGIGGGSEITVTELNVTENGTYTAPADSAYNPVNVEVPAPAPNLEDITITENGTYQASEEYDGIGTATVNITPSLPELKLISEFDFTSQTPLHDKVRDIDLTLPSGFTTSSDGLTTTSNSAYLNTYLALNVGSKYKIELELGDYTMSLIENASAVLNFSNDGQNEQSSLCWRENVGYWACYTSNGWNNASNTYTKDYFKNKKITIFYNCEYDNGEIIPIVDPTSDGTWFSFYDENMNQFLHHISSNVYGIRHIGLGGVNDYGVSGMIYKSLKVYEVNINEEE